jgi:hypothetical protein
MTIATPASQRRRPPPPLVIAAGLVAVGSFVFLVVGLLLLVTVSAPSGWILLLLCAVAASLAHGLWRGNRGARIIGTLIMGTILYLGLRELPIASKPAEFAVVLIPMVGAGAVLGLMLGPASSRAYFRR